MPRTIVTAGEKYADIDVLACAVAYAELLRLEGKDAVAVVSKDFQASITPSVLAWGGVYETTYEAREGDDFILVDVSEPGFVASFVDHARVREVYDHRLFGYEEHWRTVANAGLHIEAVGSCATLIWEQVVARGFADVLSQPSTRLLFAAIVSNSLDLHALVTNDRDRRAYADLQMRSELPTTWVAAYFAEQEQEVMQDVEKLLSNDTKVLSVNAGTIAIGQLELWDANVFVAQHAQEMEQAMRLAGSETWFVTIASISEGKNYLFTTDAKTKTLVEHTLSVHFDGDIACTEMLMMRKEIIPLLTS
jgi:inorganic pyrophosphatase/exopolyphosphatase